MNKGRTARLDRLVGAGDGQELRGGGMPLPPLFDTILDLLQEHGEQTVAELARPVEQAIRKPERLAVLYPHSQEPWGDFVRDGLAELELRRIVERHGDAWRLGPNFKAGELMLAIPARKGKSSAIHTKVYPPAEWQARERDDHRRMEINSAYALLRRSAAGLRPVNDRHIETIAESIRAFGWLDGFPVLVDQNDHVLDGRHRIEAARRAGVAHTERRIIVSSPSEALAIAYAANEGRPWLPEDRKRIAGLVMAEGASTAEMGRAVGQKAMRMLIEARLREHPEWSDRLIAKTLGCSDKTVTTVRTELEASAEIPQSDQLLGEDGRWYKNKRTAGTEAPDPRHRKSPTDGKRARALALITAAGGVGISQQEVIEKSGLNNRALLMFLAADGEALRTLDNRWYTPESLPIEDVAGHYRRWRRILKQRAPEELAKLSDPDGDPGDKE